MIRISYASVILLISLLWILVRSIVWAKQKNILLKRETQLLLVYICLVVVARFTFFPFEKADGNIQPLLFDAAAMLPSRINFIPFVNLMNYPEKRSALLNLIGNTAMFIPLGIVWPSVFRELNTHQKVIAAGFGFSLAIEILQLPFFDRVTDIDDLILNTLGYLIGYGLFLAVRKRKKHRRSL